MTSKPSLKTAVFKLMDEKGLVSDQDIINEMGGDLCFSFHTVQGYVYEYKRKKIKGERNE